MFKLIEKGINKQIVRPHDLPAKHFLFHQGDFYDGFFVLQSGWMLVSRIDADGNRQVLRTVLPGETLGLQPDCHGPAIYSARALTNSVVCNLPCATELCSSHPSLAMCLVKTSTSDMLLTELYLAMINQHNAKEKIAFMILEISYRLKQRGLNKKNTFQFPLKQRDIADMLGLTVIHVNRILHDLKVEKILMIKNHDLIIYNYDQLIDLAGQDLIKYRDL